jgi:hypothetical protein
MERTHLWFCVCGPSTAYYKQSIKSMSMKGWMSLLPQPTIPNKSARSIGQADQQSDRREQAKRCVVMLGCPLASFCAVRGKCSGCPVLCRRRKLRWYQYWFLSYQGGSRMDIFGAPTGDRRAMSRRLDHMPFRSPLLRSLALPA